MTEYDIQEEHKKNCKKYHEFIDNYKHVLHVCCPKCGSIKYSATLVGYVYNASRAEEYKDENECTCSDCGDVHICHERISISAAEKI